MNELSPDESGILPATSTETQAVEEPDFSFLGTDGEYYFIGETPHDFVLRLEGLFQEQSGKPPELTRKELDEWIWMHVRVWPGQRHLLLEDVQRIYFEVDIPYIVTMIYDRLANSQQAVIDAFNIIADRSKGIMEDLRKNREKIQNS